MIFAPTSCKNTTKKYVFSFESTLKGQAPSRRAYAQTLKSGIGKYW